MIAFRRTIQESGASAACSLRRLVFDRSRSISTLTRFLLQLLGLWVLNAAGVWAVGATELPVPGNLVGMVALYVLLSLGVVKVSWFDATGSFLIKHLAFFFIPITVGLMEWGGVMAAHGIGIAVVLIGSAIIGIALAGLISQLLITTTSRSGDAE